MNRREIVRRAIQFDAPPRLPFWQHWNRKIPWAPDDVCNIWEMDRQQAGWFFDRPGPDDWGCGWGTTDVQNMGQVVEHPLREWSDLDRYRPPDPRNAFYYERLDPLLDEAGDRYVAITAHTLLFSRLHKLRGFATTMEDFYLAPECVHRALDMIADFKIQQCDELHRRFGDRIDALFLADDWGTQAGNLRRHKDLRRVLCPEIPPNLRRHPRPRLARNPAQLRPDQRLRARTDRIGR